MRDLRYLLLMRRLGLGLPMVGGRKGVLGSDPWSWPSPEPAPRPPLNPRPRPNPEWPGGLRPPAKPKPGASRLIA